MKNAENTAAAVQSSKAAAFTKEQLVKSEKFKDRRDVLSALLDGGKKYTLEETVKIIDNFLKGKVE